MRCPTCETEGKRSSCRVVGASSYDQPSHGFRDGDGVHHLHRFERDGWTEWGCDRGHVWRVADPPAGCNIPGCAFNEQFAKSA